MNFAERYKTYTNTELLRIIDNPGDYQPEAVETAKDIFASRDLSDKEIEIAGKELEAEKQQESDRKEKIDRIKNKASSILDEANPIRSKIPPEDKIINIVSIILGILYMYQRYKEIGFISYLFSNIRDWDWDLLLYLLPLIVVPVSIILFYKRKKSGWILIAMYLTYSAISVLGTIIMTIGAEPTDTPLDILIPVSPSIYIFPFLFYAGMICGICKQNLREIYTVDKQTMILTITITTVILGIIFLIYFL